MHIADLTNYFHYDVVNKKTKSIQMFINSLTMKVDGNNRLMDVAPYVANNRTYVPLRSLSEAFGADVKWMASSNTVKIELDSKTIIMQIGNLNYWVNGQRRFMDVAPEIQGSTGRSFVPVRFIAEAFGFNVNPQYGWDGRTTSVIFMN